MQSTNQLGQPVADDHLLAMLKAVAPVLSQNETLSVSLQKQESLLQNTQTRLDKIKVPFIDNDKHDLFNPDREKKYLIALIICAAIAILGIGTGVLFILFGIPAVVLFFLHKGIRDIRTCNQTIIQTKEEIQRLQQTLKTNNETLSHYNIDVIPEKYREGEILEFFYDVLSTQRATNMQQAINLYEEHLRNKKIDEMQKQQLENLKRIEALAQENANMRAQLNSQQNNRR